MAKYFNINGISGRISHSNIPNGCRYVITAENEKGDTFKAYTNDSEVYDYISDEDNEFNEHHIFAQEYMKRRLEDDEYWLRKATIKTFPTNATIFYGDEIKEISYDLQPDFFDSYQEAEEWIDDELWGIKDILNNYAEIKRDIMIRLSEFINNQN